MNDGSVVMSSYSRENKELNDGQTESMNANDWKRLFAPLRDQTLKFYPLQNSEGKVRVALPDEVFDEGEMQ